MLAGSPIAEKHEKILIRLSADPNPYGSHFLRADSADVTPVAALFSGAQTVPPSPSTPRGSFPSMKTAPAAPEHVSPISAEPLEKLLLEHVPQVKYIARRIHDRLPPQVPIEDLISAGVLGLMDALQKYDPKKNVQLKSYAKFRIRGAILDSLRELDWSPRDLRRKARQIEAAHGALRERLGRAATETELAAELSMTLDELHKSLGDLRGLEISSLQTPTGTEGQEQPLSEVLPNRDDHDPLFLCLQDERKDLLHKAIDELPEKERQVLSLYYFEELTMKEVGVVLGVGESRVSQVHSAALTRLRSYLAGELGMQAAPHRMAHGSGKNIAVNSRTA